MKLCTAVQEGYGYKDSLRAHRYFVPLAKYFTVRIIYQPAYVIRHFNFIFLIVPITSSALEPNIFFGTLFS
jgi:hypothetical protein